MGRRVLVTGATGLIGQHLPALLGNAGYDVLVATRRPQSPDDVAMDILDGLSVSRVLANEKPTYLIHLAWHDGTNDRWGGMENIDWIAATTHLMKAFSENGGERAVAVGSCAEYDWSYEVLREDTPLRPESLYGKSKASTGAHLMDTATDHGLSLAWARPFFCFGPHEPRGRLIGDLIYGLASGNRVACSDGLQVRDYLHTGDIARALICVLGSNFDGAINIGAGQGTRVRDIIDTMAEIFGRPDLIDIGAKERPLNDPPRLVADTAKLRALGFEPKFDLTTGLMDCASRSAPQAALTQIA